MNDQRGCGIPSGLPQPAPGILLGALSLLRAWAGFPPKDMDYWDNLLVLTYFPGLFLLVMDGFLLLGSLYFRFFR